MIKSKTSKNNYSRGKSRSFRGVSIEHYDFAYIVAKAMPPSGGLLAFVDLSLRLNF